MPTGQRSRAKRTSEQDLLYEEKAKEKLCDIPNSVRRVSIPGKADRFDHTLPWHSHLYCTVCGSVTDAEVDEKQVMKLVKNQKGYVQDCAVVLIGVCEVCCEKQAQENAH